MVHLAILSTLSPPIFLVMGSENLGVKPNDLWPTTFDLETFPEQDIWPDASASPSPECAPTSEAAAMALRLLEQVFIDIAHCCVCLET